MLSLWTSKINALQNSRCNEFVGRLAQGNKAELYQHLKDDKYESYLILCSVSVLVSSS